jgi:ADP-dependent NAD(P)H-hydrate dehydratase / NAD(P)H-hydrate epimerase
VFARPNRKINQHKHIMAKILTAAQIRAADAYTIEHEPIASIDLMERAAGRITDWLLFQYLSEDREKRILVFAGMGNNGGDGLAIARQLWAAGVRNVEVFLVVFSEHTSNDFAQNLQILPSSIPTTYLLDPSQLQDIRIDESDMVLDAIFGSGLKSMPSGIAAATIAYLNSQTPDCLLAIDIPSGLFAEDNPDIPLSDTQTLPIIRANQTLSFQVPKLAFFFDAHAQFTGEWDVLSIGLHSEFLASVQTPYYMLTNSWAKSVFRTRKKDSHKGTYGHGLLAVGSRGKMGAALLAAKAALRSGIGLLTLHLPSCGEIPLQTALPEAMLLLDSQNDYLSHFDGNLQNYQAVGCGCGIAQNPATVLMLEALLEKSPKNLVLDADALNILAQKPALWNKIPAQTILTPHPKEWQRLFGEESNPYARLQKSRTIAQEKNVVIVLKGAYTAIVCPDGEVFFNRLGNAGMATGGMGDALTGILVALLAQGYTPSVAACLGVWAHAKAGDFAAQKSQTALLPSDLIENLHKVWLPLETC